MIKRISHGTILNNKNQLFLIPNHHFSIKFIQNMRDHAADGQNTGKESAYEPCIHRCLVSAAGNGQNYFADPLLLSLVKFFLLFYFFP